ncbi:hypothetical protein VNO77_21649 [Canavalia gladiata]|uniref:Bifunctional inhibitor/plant lipid transfer protein/seed storage helical domain-containing protein n=1 Tax=Canavalia gladiata TaxID=3824 RepID=A0AAN9LSH3_CANGL
MMKKVSTPCVVVCAVVLTLLLADIGTMVEAVNCSPSELSPCAPALGGAPPTSACCQKLIEQKPCLCGYIKDPNLKQYVNSPAARKMASTCGVQIPRC